MGGLLHMSGARVYLVALGRLWNLCVGWMGKLALVLTPDAQAKSGMRKAAAMTLPIPGT